MFEKQPHVSRVGATIRSPPTSQKQSWPPAHQAILCVCWETSCTTRIFSSCERNGGDTLLSSAFLSLACWCCFSHTRGCPRSFIWVSVAVQAGMFAPGASPCTSYIESFYCNILKLVSYFRAAMLANLYHCIKYK